MLSKKQPPGNGLVIKAQSYNFANDNHLPGISRVCFSLTDQLSQPYKYLKYKLMNPKFYLFGILLVIGANLTSHAQVSYNKRAMGAIGTIPKASDFMNGASLDNVDMVTGTLKVGIPLYEIKVNDISVPITLNYSATGLKVGQAAGPAGMGWELNAGGRIITNVQGRPDGPSGTGVMPLEVLANPLIYDPYSTHKSLTENIIDGKTDAAWDTYTYVLPNGGGTYTKDGLTYPYDPLVSVQHPGVIKTTDGLVYNFQAGEKKKTTRRYYYDAFSSQLDWAELTTQWARDYYPTTTSNWDLSNIVSTKFKDTVSFNYETIVSSVPLASRTRISTSESIPFIRDVESNSNYQYSELQQKYYRILDPIIAQSKTEVLAHTRIQAINFKNGQVSFEYSVNDTLGNDILLNIKIYQKLNGITKILKKYEFVYDLSPSTLMYGHYLIGINVFDSDDVKLNGWSFTYLNRMPVYQKAENKAQDRWGFYNGKTSNKTLLEHPDKVLALNLRDHYPITNNPYSMTMRQLRYSRPEATEIYGHHPVGTDGVSFVEFADRDFSLQDAAKGILTSIKTPTGGTVSYGYEAHKFIYDRYINNTFVREYIEGGGIRIRDITTDRGNAGLYAPNLTGRTIKKIYKYGEGSFGASGHPYETSGYGQVTIPGNVLSNTSKYWSPSSAAISYDIDNIMLLSHPVNDMTQYNGSYCMYRTVTEELVSSDELTSFGKAVYYNTILESSDMPDFEWKLNGTPPIASAFRLPSLYVNSGVKKQPIVGTNGIKKYKFKDGLYLPVEETRYTFKSFNAPPPLQYQTRLLSFYGTVKSQLSGPFPGGNEQVRDQGVIDPSRGGVVIYLFNATRNTTVGKMDYLAATNLTQENNTHNFQGKYEFRLIDMSSFSNCIRKETEQTLIAGDDQNTALITDTKYYYDNPAHLLPTRVVTINSKEDSVVTRTRYAQDYSAGNSTLDFMRNNKIGLSEPVEEFVNYKRGANEYIKDGSVNTFRVDNNVLLNDKVYKINLNSNLAYNGPYYSALDTTLFKPQISYDHYVNGNIYKYTEATGSGNVVIWGYGNQYPIAKVSNAGIGGYTPSEEVAYTSFESQDKGNWIYSGAPVADLSSPSGKRVYSLTTGPLSKIKPTSLPVKRYVVSYWYKTGATVTITGGTLTAPVIKNSKAGWTLAEREVSSLTGSLVVSGTGLIDELRFYPADAQMTTYTYEPLIGLSGSIDPKGVMQFYEYDSAQRLKNVRDQEGNIVKSYKYILKVIE